MKADLLQDVLVRVLATSNTLTTANATTASSGAIPTLRPSFNRDTSVKLNPLRSAASSQSSQQCPVPPVISCSAAAATTDTCCVVQPGGVLISSAFWDLNYGVADDWGVHGLWPDLCSGGYHENCDSSRKYTGAQISQWISASNSSLLSYMESNYVSNDESSENFWAHEWSTHGTCVSTLEPSCFQNYQEGMEVPMYFETVVALFEQLGTYQALASANIVPSDTDTYNLEDMQTAVQNYNGHIPDFICKGNTISAVQYYLNAQGPLQDGNFVASNPTRSSSCPASGISYPVKQLNTAQARDEL